MRESLAIYRRLVLSVSAVLSGLISLALWGCAVPRLDQAAWQDRRIDLVWPRAPEIPRIRLLRVVSGW